MNPDWFHLNTWDVLAPADRRNAAAWVARQLPSPFKFSGMQRHHMGDQAHELAFFDWNGAAFALVPGGQVTLGYDRDDPFILTEAMRDEWEADTRDEYKLELNAYLDKSLTPLRTAFIEPFLLEVGATELAQPLDIDDPGIRAEMARLKPQPGSGYQIFGSIRSIRIEVDRAGRAYVVDGEPVSRQGTLEAISRHDFRFPTSNEWEYACAGGSRSLFRWGNDCPVEQYPVDSGGWTIHHQPNAFGLRMPTNPYHWEFCQETTLMRGGDGGMSICGSMGFLAGWLPLASAYAYLDEDGTLPQIEGLNTYLRRAYSLPTLH